MKPEKEKKIEKTVGYALLVIGLILIILPACLAIWTFLRGTQIPQLIPIPAGETSESVKSMVIFSNVCLIFFILIITVWAGSIISSRGVTLVKEIKLKVARESLSEEAEVVKEKKAEKP